MSRLNILGGAAVAALMFGAAEAQAADMPVYYEQAEFGGWYLRGDVGVSHQRLDRLYYERYDDPASGIDDWESLEENFDASWFVGLGVGYQFNEWLRADITGEYRGKSDFYGLHAFDTDADGALDDLLDEYVTEKSEWTFLANVYWDITTWHSITPFVGVGVGASYNKIHDVFDTNLLDPTSTASCPTNGCAESNGEWQLAWALHAGLAFSVAPNIAVEVAYRYLHLGDGESDELVGNTGTTFGLPLEFEDLNSHDVKIGLRYGFQ